MTDILFNRVSLSMALTAAFFPFSLALCWDEAISLRNIAGVHPSFSSNLQRSMVPDYIKYFSEIPLNSLGNNSLVCDLKLPKGNKTSTKTDAELKIFEWKEPLHEQ